MRTSLTANGRRPAALALLAALALAHGGRAQPAAAIRAEVPVREVVLSDGTRRYGVPIRVGDTDIEAGLDSGSTGLRILPNVLKPGDAEPTGREDSYSYGAGAKLDGVVGRATVAVGALHGQTTVQLVRRVGCTDQKPHCAAGSIPVAQYGVQGDGLPGEGFKAILGVNMADADAASLFKGIGAHRWIIDLPRPNEGAPGRIVLNPTDAEVQGYAMLPVLDAFSASGGGAHDSVRGCIVNLADQRKICGAVLADTGAPGLLIAGDDLPAQPWPNGTPAALVLADGAGRVRVRETLVIGLREHASRLTFVERGRRPMTILYAGLTPYFAYSILYDPEHGEVGFKPRPAAAQGPRADDPPN